MTLKLRVCQQKTQYLRQKKAFFNRRHRSASVIAKNSKKNKMQKNVQKR